MMPIKRQKLIIAVHGILTGETSAAWQDRFKHFVWLRGVGACGGGVDVQNREYKAGPFPMWNVFVKNHFLASALADFVLDYAEDGADISFLAHSNGADVALKTIKALARENLATRALVCIAGAIQSDVMRTGIADLIHDGKLGRAVAYCSHSDEALRLAAIWPYGHLGRDGFTSSDADHTAVLFDSGSITTRFYPDFGHSTYFDADHEKQTFDQAVKDCCYL